MLLYAKMLATMFVLNLATIISPKVPKAFKTTVSARTNLS
jgi:hypothetical protein